MLFLAVVAPFSIADKVLTKVFSSPIRCLSANLNNLSARLKTESSSLSSSILSSSLIISSSYVFLALNPASFLFELFL